MTYRARRSLAGLSLIALGLGLAGCSRVTKHHTTRVMPPGVFGVLPDRMVGFTLSDGRAIRFDSRASAVVRDDSLRYTARGATHAVAMSDVQRVWVKSFDPGRTALLVVGVAAVLAFLAALDAGEEVTVSCPNCGTYF